jgi:hypothetical protein
MKVGDIVLFRTYTGVVLSLFTRLYRGRSLTYAKCFWFETASRSSWPMNNMKVISEKR